MADLYWYFLFLMAWVFFQSLWISKLAKQVAALQEELDGLKKSRNG